MLQLDNPSVISSVQARPQPVTIEEPILDTYDIQGNSLGGFNKDHEMLIFFKMTQVAAAKKWLRSIEPFIATAAEVIAFNQLFKTTRRRRHGEEGTVRSTFINIGFTFEGLKKLTPDADQFTDAAFKEGLHNRSASLGDPTDPKAAGHQSQWVIGVAHNVPDGVLIVASDDPSHLATTVKELEKNFGPGLKVMVKQRGETLPGALAGHEHFGFKDGISQPGIRGRLPQSPHEFLTKREDPEDPNKGKPGQDLIHAGEFIFGYPTQIGQPDPDREGLNLNLGETAIAGPAWAKNGSYLVFRRLRQDVKGFHAFVKSAAAVLSQSNPAFAGMTKEKFGAKLVGRWASGAPIVNNPDRDNPNDANELNFEFEDEDAQGLRCPFAGHIRKTYPRDTERGSFVNESATQTHRLLRRGIPFGKPMSSGCPVSLKRLRSLFSDWMASLAGTDTMGGNKMSDRGLLFLAYQTSIERQFEFVTNFWVNNPDFSDSGNGHDPILGQSQDPTTRDRSIVLQAENPANNATVKLPKDWVIPTGGGYFFTPSIQGLKHLAK